MKRVVVLSALVVASLVLISLLGCMIDVPFLAGQDEEAGVVIVANFVDIDDGVHKLGVGLTLSPPWVLGVPPVTHVAIGTSVATDRTGINWVDGIPQNKAGNPKVSKFPYELEELEPGVYGLLVPLADIGVVPCNWVYVAVHAEVYNTEDLVVDPDSGDLVPREESAWADGEQFNPGKSWAMFVPYHIQED